jgi:hypothetical protein
MDEYLMAEGRHEELYRKLGAHPVTHEGAEGTAFAVWAPNARRVSVVGDFNAWDGRRNPMRQRGQTGIWEIFLPGVARGAVYKYEILGPQGDLLPLKADPFAFRAEPAPATASIVDGLVRHEWTDDGWMAARGDLRERPCRSTRSTSAAGGGAGRRSRSTTARSATTSSTTSATWASPMWSSCRSPNIPSPAPGATSPSASSPHLPLRHAGRLRGVSSTGCTAPASA